MVVSNDSSFLPLHGEIATQSKTVYPQPSGDWILPGGPRIPVISGGTWGPYKWGEITSVTPFNSINEDRLGGPTESRVFVAPTESCRALLNWCWISGFLGIWTCNGKAPQKVQPSIARFADLICWDLRYLHCGLLLCFGMALGVKRGGGFTDVKIDLLFSPIRSLGNYAVIFWNGLEQPSVYIYIYILELKTWDDFGTFGRRISFCS